MSFNDTLIKYVSDVPKEVFSQFTKGILVVSLEEFRESPTPRGHVRVNPGATFECEYCRETSLVRIKSISDFLLGNNRSNRIVFCKKCQPLSEYYKSYIKGAKARDISFNLTVSQFNYIIKHNCIYCDAPPEQRYCSNKKIAKRFSGIDRVDPKKGYEIENCVPCCTTHNIMKRDMTTSDFLQSIHDIYWRMEKVGWEFKR